MSSALSDLESCCISCKVTPPVRVKTQGWQCKLFSHSQDMNHSYYLLLWIHCRKKWVGVSSSHQGHDNPPYWAYWRSTAVAMSAMTTADCLFYVYNSAVSVVCDRLFWMKHFISDISDGFHLMLACQLTKQSYVKTHNLHWGLGPSVGPPDMQTDLWDNDDCWCTCLIQKSMVTSSRV